uniref:G-protein coupled receptors family 1 profile domain-containing protein n=1 Tax=Globodera rostochiensis TaxID=31243 RepID=A0A914I8J3_GLORO
MLWWLKTVFAAAAFIYLFTLLVGLLGNSWVIASLLRTGTKTSVASVNSLNPSDRLRKYIWLLSLLDIFISGSLTFRVWHLLFPDQQLSDNACRWMFAIDQSFKMCSLTCLACISIERFITIRKPFNNKVRKFAVKLTPLFALFTMTICGGAIFWLCVRFIGATDDGLNCTQRELDNGQKSPIGKMVAGWTLAIGFFVQLGVIESNYVRIVLHVRRKFWQRKARAAANSVSEKCLRHDNSPSPISAVSGDSQPRVCARLIKRASPPPLLVLSEPRYPHYMRDMTTAIRRIAVFHLICWLPYCLLFFLPSLHPSFRANLSLLQVRATFAVRIVDNRQHNWAAWAAFVANWLTYFNSAGNWVLYAALNRDLRSIIKACSERRKRSTMSHHNHHHPQQQTGSGTGQPPSPANPVLKQSIRRGALKSLRFFYSLNSHRSSASSIEADFAEAHSVATTVGQLHNASSPQPNGSCASPNNSLRAPSSGSDSFRRKQSAQSSVSSGGVGAMPRLGPAELGTFGWRDGRAYSYCSPATASRDPLLINSPSPIEQRSFGALFEHLPKPDKFHTHLH